MKRIISFMMVLTLLFLMTVNIFAAQESDITSEELPQEISFTYQPDTGFYVEPVSRSYAAEYHASLDENGYYKIDGENEFPDNLRLKPAEDESRRLIASEKVTIDLYDSDPFGVLVHDYGYSLDNPMIQDLRQLQNELTDEISHSVDVYVGTPSTKSSVADSSYTTTWKGRTIRDDSYSITSFDSNGGFKILSFTSSTANQIDSIVNNSTIAIDWQAQTRALPAWAMTFIKMLGSMAFSRIKQQIMDDIRSTTTTPYLMSYTTRTTTKIYSYVLDSGNYYLGCIVGRHDFTSYLTYYGASGKIDGDGQDGTLSSPLWGSTARLDKAIASYDPIIGGYVDLPAYVYISVNISGGSSQSYRRSWAS